jgi:hypothetical protein
MAGPQKITFGDMRDSGVRAVLIYCSDYRCSHWIEMIADHGPMIEAERPSSRASSTASVAAEAPMSGRMPILASGRSAIDN